MNYARCIKSVFGAVTFNKRVVCSFMLKSGKECDGFITLISGADFRRDDHCRLLILKLFLNFSSHQEDMIGLLNDCF